MFKFIQAKRFQIENEQKKPSSCMITEKLALFGSIGSIIGTEVRLLLPM